MDLQTYLDRNKITKYHLSQISGVPKTTIMDICAGRSEISRCSARTIQQLAKALEITMEDVMEFETAYESETAYEGETAYESETTYDSETAYVSETGLPEDRGYLECGLPEFLQESVRAMEEAWRKLDCGEEYLRWDCDFCNLQTDINNAEVNQIISSEQAWYLREKYLGIERCDGMPDL